MRRRILQGFGVLTAFALFLGGCGGASGQGEAPSNAPAAAAADTAAVQESSEASSEAETGAEGASDTEKPSEGAGTDLSAIKTGTYSAGISCHDPQILLAGDGKYYMTGSHMILAESEDLISWDYISNGNSKNYISNLYSGNLPAFSYVGKNEQGGYSVWAGNLYYNETMKKYMLYFCTSSSYIKSTLALAQADKPEGPYTFTDTLLCSGFSKSEAPETNIFEVMGEDWDVDRYLHLGGYDNNKWPNCIDPAVFTDADGRMWMVYGSWSGGLFLLELDPSTGLIIHPEEDPENGVDPYFGYHLIAGGHHACEGPYIHYNPDNGYYYLFASFGRLERTGGYQIREFRSENVTGPYLDAAGQLMGDEEDYPSYGLKVAGNYTFPSLSDTYMAPGGQSTFTAADGELYITYHQRFDNGDEYHEPRVHRLFLNEDGWYVMSPFETSFETLPEDGFDPAELEGAWFLVDHGTDVSDVVHPAVECAFSGGSINGELSGDYAYDAGSPYITLKLEGTEYRGVVFDMTDEAGNPVRCISACGDNNKSIWGVKYL
ncbi:MAG: glycoside hydrolase family 43 protein [Lachnospiraceae bacterium]|nr:glycoside hydrolase family 43 protein [Lachnospiraceae bacterium]